MLGLKLQSCYLVDPKIRLKITSTLRCAECVVLTVSAHVTPRTTSVKGRLKRNWRGNRPLVDTHQLSLYVLAGSRVLNVDSRYAKYHIVEVPDPHGAGQWKLPPHASSGSVRKTSKWEPTNEELTGCNQMPRQVVTRVRAYMHAHKLSQVVMQRAAGGCHVVSSKLTCRMCSAKSVKRQRSRRLSFRSGCDTSEFTLSCNIYLKSTEMTVRRYKGNNAWVDAALNTWLNFMTMERHEQGQRQGHDGKPQDEIAPQQLQDTTKMTAKDERESRAASPDSPAPFSYTPPTGAPTLHPTPPNALEQLVQAACVRN